MTTKKAGQMQESKDAKRIIDVDEIEPQRAMQC
jgi:hypothetical protein